MDNIYEDYRLYLANALSRLLEGIEMNGIFEEASGWLCKYGKYNEQAVMYLKEDNTFSQQEFHILDEITFMMCYYEEALDTEGNCLKKEDESRLENLINTFLSSCPA